MVENGQLSSSVHHDRHGNSVAAWTTVGVMMVGFLLMSVAVAVPSWLMFAGGALVVAAGAIAGKVLSAMGFGASGRTGS